MTVFSVGILYSAQQFLEIIETSEITEEGFLRAFQNYHVADPKYILEVSQSCGWASIDARGRLKITDAGRIIRKSGTPELQLRSQLEDIISWVRSSWVKRLQYGRAEAVKYMPSEVKQVFEEAGLLDPLNSDIVECWDRLSLAVRNNKQQVNLKIGRDAEKRSIEYEMQRTLSAPKWQGMESSHAGFDILSVKDRYDHSPIRIEVKGSILPKSEASFHLTRNEWDVATTSGSYYFHLWLMHKTPKLTIVDSSELATHVSLDQGSGKWDNVRIPFNAFA